MSAVNYKVGDKVIVKSLDWYNENKNASGNVNVPCCFVVKMSKYCGKVVTIKHIGCGSYNIFEDNGNFMWSDEMFEGLFEGLAEKHKFYESKNVEDLPKDFASCANLVGANEDDLYPPEYKVIICRDAYLALSDNWKPDYKKKTKKYCVVIRDGKVCIVTTISKPRKLAFPTPEMAVAFIKNFKKDIEVCDGFKL